MVSETRIVNVRHGVKKVKILSLYNFSWVDISKRQSYSILLNIFVGPYHGLCTISEFTIRITMCEKLWSINLRKLGIHE